MNESKHTNYLKLQVLNDQNSELELSRDRTRISNDMERSQMEKDMLVIEKTVSAENLVQVAQQIKQSTELEDPQKHNLLVDLNAGAWELSRSRKIFSVVVLVLLTLGQMSSQWERGVLTPAF